MCSSKSLAALQLPFTQGIDGSIANTKGKIEFRLNKVEIKELNYDAVFQYFLTRLWSLVEEKNPWEAERPEIKPDSLQEKRKESRFMTANGCRSEPLCALRRTSTSFRDGM